MQQLTAVEAPTLHTQPLKNTLPWIQVAPDAPYFITEQGQSWTPIGQNDAVTWPEFAGLFRQKDMAAVEKHLAWLAGHGVTCLRFMLEYCQTENRYIERPVGRFAPNMVRLWDDLFALCEQYGMRVLLTPYDTFWMWIRWKHHPYNQAHGGPCSRRSRWLLCPDTLAAIKSRLTFAAERWGGSGALFAWDLWNEIHPSHADNTTHVFYDFVSEISSHLRAVETRLYGRTHLQTVSLFGPVLYDHPAVADVIFRHPQLDFATTHFYDTATINHPKDTVGSAICTGALVREALEHLHTPKPFFDSEHGPIHTFKDKHRTLPEPFDDEYFRHIQWAHLASGAAGGGMRWPNRKPHILTSGMRAAQLSLASFVKFIDWPRFRRRNLNQEMQLSTPAFAGFACGDDAQAVVWLLRQDSTLKKPGTIRSDVKPLPVQVTLPGLREGSYTVYLWDTLAGKELGQLHLQAADEQLIIELSDVSADLALAVIRTP
jgi:mannan endo-1,4-beta-mannosidase